MRPLVEAVAALHQRRVVHRDIKPGNVFVGEDDRLILGDLGLVFFMDDQRTRVTDTIESVGTTQWMPGWAIGMRLDDVRPMFDVFSLGKLLWALVSGRPMLRLWYHRQESFNLELQFPDGERIVWVNRLLDGGIVELESNITIHSAGELLTQIDSLLEVFRRGGQVVEMSVTRKCKVCGMGWYQVILDEAGGPAAVRNFGLNPVAGQRWRAFRCVRCGHVQMFQMDPKPPAWGE